MRPARTAASSAATHPGVARVPVPAVTRMTTTWHPVVGVSGGRSALLRRDQSLQGGQSV